jgi:predicted nucleic acid-binding protein
LLSRRPGFLIRGKTTYRFYQVRLLDPATSQSQAQSDVAKVIAAGVELREDIDEAFWQMVGQFKVSPGKISLAHCFVLALAIRTGATLVTSDHEFDRIVPLGLCPILFIR